MPITIQAARHRPNSAPAYYLGRPASFWLTLTTGRRRAPATCRETTWAPIARQAA